MSVIDPPAAAVPGLAEARPVHARWSAMNGEFLDHAAAGPAFLERATFGSIYEAEWLRKLDLQPWPLFMGVEQRAEVERITLGMDRLVKGAMERFLAGDPLRVLDYFNAGKGEPGGGAISTMNEKILEIVLKEPDGIRGAPARLDFMEGAAGLQCLEYNAGSFLGGLQTGAIGDRYLASPPVARFLEARNRRARAPDTVGALMRHLADETARLGVWSGGDFEVVVMIGPSDPAQMALHAEPMYDEALQRVIRERGIAGGRARTCLPSDIRDEPDGAYVGDRRVHAVVDLSDGSRFPRELFRHFKEGRLNFLSGPIGGILSDKRNLVLLSENAASDEFTAEERALIEQCLPWTRKVAPGRARLGGRTLRLPDDLVEHRERLVLKKASSMAGVDVRVGPFRTDAEWREDVAVAVREGSWIVQEYLEPLPYLFQNGERGAVRHDMVWGLFAFGDHYGGAFLRMQPRGGKGVVNTEQGAEVGVFLELEN